jgi:translocation and assembly module TamB
MKKWLKRIGFAIVALLVVAALLAGWLVGTESGARFVLSRAQGALPPGQLEVTSVRGSLAGPLELGGLRFRDSSSGVDARVQTLRVDPSLFALVRSTLHLNTLDLDGVDVALTTVPPPPNPPPPAPLQKLLTPPLAMLLDRVHVARVNVALDGKPLFVADTVDAGFTWTTAGLALKQLAVRAPQGRIDLSGTLDSYLDYRGRARLDGDWLVAPPQPQQPPPLRVAAKLDLVNDGRSANFTLTLAQPLAANANGNVALDHAAAWNGTLDVPAFDPAKFGAGDAVKSLALNLKGSGDRGGGTVSGSLDANAHRVLFDPFKFAYADQVLTIETLHLRSPEAPGTLNASGKVQLAAQPVGGTLEIGWDGVELPADLVGQALATNGAISASGNAQQFGASGDLSIGPPGKPAHLGIDLAGTPEKIALHRLELKQPKGGLSASGDIVLQPRTGWTLEAKADKLDPGAFAAQWPGSLTFALSTTGTVAADGPHGKLKLSKLSGTLRQRALSGNGEIAFAPPLSLDGALDLASGGSRVALRGRGGAQTDATVELAIASLGDWLPQAAGAASTTLAVKGAWPHLDVSGDVHASKLAVDTLHVAQLDAKLQAHDVADAPNGSLDLQAQRVASGSYAFDSLTVKADGNQGKHALQLDARGSPLAIALALDGSLATPQGGTTDWRGTLSALTLEIKDQPAWKLQAPATIAWAGGALTLAETCLQSDTPRVCASAQTQADSSLKAKYTLQRLPLATIVRLAAPDAPLRVAGEIDGSGDLARDAAGALSGHATLASATGSVTYPDEATQPLLAYHAFSTEATLAPQQSTVTVSADFDDGGQLRGHATLGAAGASGMALAGEISAHLGQLRFVDLLTTSVAATKGTLDGQLTLGGTTNAPALAGQLALAGFATEVPAAGLKLSDGNIKVQSSDGKSFAIDGTIASGGGKLALSGNAGLDATQPLALKIDGENFLAADIPGAQVRIAPALTLQRDGERYTLNGEVTIPKADVDLAKLPGAGATKTSSDVVVTDEAAAPAATALPLDAVVTVKLGAGEKLAMDLRQGREVHLVGFGLDGNLGGQLTVQDHAGRATTGRGQIEVNGTYKAYGQDLKIEQGRLLFAGTPVENPGLDIRATRAFPDQEVTVGLQVRGTAEQPELTVFSSPAMEQSDALSYLVAGKPLSQLKGGEGDAVGNAARALGPAGGDLLAKSIGAKMGVDDVGIADSAAVGGAALTIGKYLSPRLYLSYGVGLFSPGQVVTLRYKLTRHFDAEMANGTLSSRAGINYRIEK